MLVTDSGTGSTGKLKTDIARHNIDLSLRRYLSENRLQPFVEAGATLSFLHAKENQVTFGEASYSYDKCKWLTPWGVFTTGGLRYNFNDVLFSELRAGLKHLRSENMTNDTKGITYPEFGINLGIRLSR